MLVATLIDDYYKEVCTVLLVNEFQPCVLGSTVLRCFDSCSAAAMSDFGIGDNNNVLDDGSWGGFFESVVPAPSFETFSFEAEPPFDAADDEDRPLVEMVPDESISSIASKGSSTTDACAGADVTIHLVVVPSTGTTTDPKTNRNADRLDRCIISLLLLFSSSIEKGFSSFGQSRHRKFVFRPVSVSGCREGERDTDTATHASDKDTMRKRVSQRK